MCLHSLSHTFTFYSSLITLPRSRSSKCCTLLGCGWGPCSDFHSLHPYLLYNWITFWNRCRLFIIHCTIDDASKRMTIFIVKSIIESHLYICNVQVSVLCSTFLCELWDCVRTQLHITAVYLGVILPSLFFNNLVSFLCPGVL